MQRKSKTTSYNKNLKELQRVVKNFNAKVDRLKAKELDLELPEKLSFKEIKGVKSKGVEPLVTNVKEIKNMTKTLKSFTKKGAEEKTVTLDSGIKVTKWEFKTLDKLNKQGNELRRERLIELAKIPFMVRGEPQYYTEPISGQRIPLSAISQGKTSIIELMPKNNNLKKVKSKEGWRRARQHIFRAGYKGSYNKRDAQFKENYIRTLEENFNSDSDQLVRMLKYVPSDEFYRMTQSEERIRFQYLYPSGNYGAALNALFNYWKRTATSYYSENDEATEAKRNIFKNDYADEYYQSLEDNTYNDGDESKFTGGESVGDSDGF